LENSLGDATQKIMNNIESNNKNNIKTKAKILKSILIEAALKEGVELTKKRRTIRLAKCGEQHEPL